MPQVCAPDSSALRHARAPQHAAVGAHRNGHGDSDDHEVMIRLPMGVTDSLEVRYVWGSEVGRETIPLKDWAERGIRGG